MLRGSRQRLELKRLEPAEREIGNIRDVGVGQFIDESVILPMGQIVVVLDADNFAQTTRFPHLVARHVAYAYVPDQAPTLEIDQHR